MRRIVFSLLFAVVFGCAASAGEGLIPNRMARAKVGEWMLMRDIAGETAGEQNRYTVVKVEGADDAKIVTLSDERFTQDGQLIESREIEIPMGRFSARLVEFEEKAKQISRERVTVKDREISVVAATWDDAEKGREIKVWMSEELPVGGFVKSWSSDPNFPAAEVVDFGE